MISMDEVISQLKLEKHPEGGYFRRTYKAETEYQSGRATASAIYFLMPRGVRSRWHKTDGDELWFWHAGAPLKLRYGDDYKGNLQIDILGPDLMHHHLPQSYVPANLWQSAEVCTETDSPYDWTLVSCVVSPEFQFSGFVMAEE